MELTIKHTRLITLLLISFIMMILIAGFGTAAGSFFNFIYVTILGALLILSFPLSSFIDIKLCVQLLI